MSTNKTNNYNLNQWVKSDQVRMEDFNEDNAKIDAALTKKADKSALSSLQSVVNGKASTSALTALQSIVDGLKTSKADKSALDNLQTTVTAQGTALNLRNCRLFTGSYQGTGAGKPITLTFPYKPMFVFVSSSLYSNFFFASRGQSTTFLIYAPDFNRNYLVWGSRTLKWSPSPEFVHVSPALQLDAAGDTYNYFALLEVE